MPDSNLRCSKGASPFRIFHGPSAIGEPLLHPSVTLPQNY
jgi:hypothetical protein